MGALSSDTEQSVKTTKTVFQKRPNGISNSKSLNSIILNRDSSPQTRYPHPMSQTPDQIQEEMRRLIMNGSRLLLDSLSDKELAGLQQMFFSGEAEIINEGCKPYVVRKLPKW